MNIGKHIMSESAFVIKWNGIFIAQRPQVVYISLALILLHICTYWLFEVRIVLENSERHHCA